MLIIVCVIYFFTDKLAAIIEHYFVNILPVARGRIHSLDDKSNRHKSLNVVLVAVQPPKI